MPGLPTTREETVTPASIVKAATINKLQDCVIGMKKPAFHRATLPNLKLGIALGDLTWTFGAAGADTYLQTAAGAQWAMDLLMEEGDRITNVQIRARGDGASDVTYTLGYSTGSGTVILFQGTDTNRAAAWGTYDFASAPAPTVAMTPQIIAPNFSLHLFVSAVSGQHRWGNVRWSGDRL